MESEKKDYISNQETTAVYYKKPNQKMIDRYLQIYEKAKENKKIKACYLGLDKQFRIISRDSYISILTDPEVMFEYILYPQYCDGNTEIKAEMNYADRTRIFKLRKEDANENAKRIHR